MLFVIWWMGNTLAFVTLTIKKRVLLALSILFFCLYLFLGLLSMFQIYQLSELIGNNQIKYNAAWIGFLTGLSFFVIASIIIKRQQRNKKPAQPVLSVKHPGHWLSPADKVTSYTGNSERFIFVKRTRSKL